MSNPKFIQDWYLKLWSWPESVKDKIGDIGDLFQYLLPISTLVYCVFVFGLTAHYTWVYILFFLLCVATSSLLKAMFNNLRPREWDDITDHPEKSPDMDFDWSVSEGNSFSSGHSIASMAGALPWFLVNPWLGVIAFVLALFVGFSRIVVKAHWLRDVLASQAIAIGYFLLVIFFIL